MRKKNIPKPKKSRLPVIFQSKYFWLLTGFIIGFLATRLFIIFIYPYIGSIYFGGFHFHHLYMGIILSAFTLLIIYLLHRKNIFSFNLDLFLWFIVGFGLGLMFEDFSAHFIEQNDPWEWFK